MDTQRHKTQKRHNFSPYHKGGPGPTEQLQQLLEQGAKDAYSRQWHRIERGLRLNRIRLFIDEIASEYAMNKEEKDHLFLFLQKALDKKLLNTLKVVEYDSEAQRILTIKGLDMKRHPDTGKLLYELKDGKKARPDTTRKRKKEEVPSVSVPLRSPPSDSDPSSPLPVTTLTPLDPLDPLDLDGKIEEKDDIEE
jgi:hypothetical protein